jgi:hypothetical protein
MLPLALALVALAGSVSVAAAQVADGAVPEFHDPLEILPGRGTFDRETGMATLKVKRWRLQIIPQSNGIYPDQETIVLAIGEQTFTLPPGSLRVSRKGKVFTYRAPKSDTSQPIRLLRFERKLDGYRIRFKLSGLDLSELLRQDPICMPTAIIVGDDDGFLGAQFTRPNFDSRRVRLPSDCNVGNDWPWA